MIYCCTAVTARNTLPWINNFMAVMTSIFNLFLTLHLSRRFFGVFPLSTGHLCFVLLWGNINDGDFNWIWVRFVVTLRGSGWEAAACASSFSPFNREKPLNSWSWLSAPLPLLRAHQLSRCPLEAGLWAGCRVELWSVRRGGGDPPYIALNVFRGSMRWNQTAAALSHF